MANFKVGDRVVYTGQYDPYFYGAKQKGAKGTIKHVLNPNNVKVVFDADPSREFGVFPNNLTLLSEYKPIDPSFIVAVIENDTLAPNTKPRTYKTRAQAETVAAKMAEKHGKVFTVLQVVAAAIPPENPKARIVAL